MRHARLRCSSGPAQPAAPCLRDRQGPGMQLSLCHLGFLPDSPKLLTLVPGATESLPERIPFFLRQNCLRMERDRAQEPGFSARFPSPYDLLRGPLTLRDAANTYYSGELVRRHTPWGRL